mgnify:CR=1 FL=1
MPLRIIRHGISDDDQADKAQDQGNGLLAGKGFVNNEIRENHDKNRITGEDNGCQAGIGHVDPDLEENHAETDVDQPEDSQIPPIGTIEVDAALLQIADSQRHEQQPADEEPEKGQLERRERRPGNLQGIPSYQKAMAVRTIHNVPNLDDIQKGPFQNDYKNTFYYIPIEKGWQ